MLWQLSPTCSADRAGYVAVKDVSDVAIEKTDHLTGVADAVHLRVRSSWKGNSNSFASRQDHKAARTCACGNGIGVVDSRCSSALQREEPVPAVDEEERVLDGGAGSVSYDITRIVDARCA